MSNPKLSLKVLINKQKTKVLLAEANSDFVDVLLRFLTMPLGRIVRNLQNHYAETLPAIGSLNTLYTALLNLDASFFTAPGAKQMLLNPQSSLLSECRYFVCSERNCPNFNHMNISMYPDIAKCDCGKSLSIPVSVGEREDGGVLVASPLSFIITDDLRVAPIVSSIVQTLTDLGIRDIRGAEMKSLSFINDAEVGELLRLCLTSATPLTDMIIKKTGVGQLLRLCLTSVTPLTDMIIKKIGVPKSIAVKPESWILVPHISEISRKMVLKVCLQKSTNKFLFAEAMDDFVEFLCSFLTVPLAGVEFLLGEKTGLGSIHNLYRSVNGVDAKYFATPETKNRLMNPKLPHGYGSKNQFIPLVEDSAPKLYYNEGNATFSFDERDGVLVPSFKSSMESFVKKQTMCFVKDDLTLSSGLVSNISILNGLRIPLSDVKEIEFQIGQEEALRILRASITSKTVLTDALVNPMLERERCFSLNWWKKLLLLFVISVFICACSEKLSKI